MNGKIIIKKDIVNINEWFIIFSVILAPMTGLRIAKMGPAEFLCMLWIMINHKKVISHINLIFFKFWLVFLGATFLGSIWGNSVYPQESSMTGIVTWIYLAIVSISSCAILSTMSLFQLKSILNKIVIGSTFWYVSLYLYSQFFSDFILGVPIWYGGQRFSGGGTNPHQVALLLGLTALLAMDLAFEQYRGKNRLVLFGCVGISFFLLEETKSSTGLIATCSGFTFLLFNKIADIFQDQKKVKLILIFSLCIIAIIGNGIIYRAFMEWVGADSNGMGRVQIFSTFGIAFWKNPILGLGPGTHGLDGTIEFHNSYLEIFAMSGIVGFAGFVIFTVKLIARMKSSVLCLAIMLYMYIFGLAGFSARRLIFWLMISLLYVFSKKCLDKKQF